MSNEPICKACGTGFTPGPQNKTRCTSCVEANRQAKKNSCKSCKRQWIPAVFGDQSPICPRCDAEGITLESLHRAKEQARKEENGVTGEDLERLLREDTEYRKERSRAAFKRRTEEEQAELHERFLHQTKDFKKMTKSQMTKPSALNVFWTRLCAFDGAAGLLLDTEATKVDRETKVALHLAYARMRLRGFDPETLRHLDAHQFLELGADVGLLPEVTETPEEHPDPTIYFNHTQQAAAIILGAT